MKLLAFVGVTLVLSAPLVYASYLVYVKQQRLLCALKRKAHPQPQLLKRVPPLAQVPVQVQAPLKDEEEHHDVGLDLDSIPMFTPMTALF